MLIYFLSYILKFLVPKKQNKQLLSNLKNPKRKKKVNDLR